jgi:hypothetical protein
MTKKQVAPRQRARNLDDTTIEVILSVLDGWTGSLTWELLIAEVAVRTRQTYTRQALSAHERIQLAFTTRKTALAELAGRSPKQADGEEQTVEQQVIARLEAQIQRLSAENGALMEKFAVWAYNARTRGLDESFLSQPLPTVQRHKTVGA